MAESIWGGKGSFASVCFASFTSEVEGNEVRAVEGGALRDRMLSPIRRFGQVVYVTLHFNQFKMKIENLAEWVMLAAALVVAGCKPEQGKALFKDPTADLPAKFKNQENLPKPDFSEAAKDPKFQEAIKEAARLLGAQPQPLKSEAEEEVVKGGVSFDVPHEKIEAMLLTVHTNFLAKGYYLFRYDNNFDAGGHMDRVGLLATADKYAVMAAMDTNGDNYDIGTAGVIAWMKDLEQEQPFILTEIGFDYMGGIFTAPVKNAPGLAKRMYQFCPDIVDQGVETVKALAGELEKGKLYFWWD